MLVRDEQKAGRQAMDVSGSRVLLTQGQLFSFAGSETATFELAEYFDGVAEEVMVVTHGYSLGWLERFKGLSRTTVWLSNDPLLDEALEQRPPNLAWIHHQLIPEPLLRRPGSTSFVFHHMSVQHPAEFPIAYAIENALASVIVFPAEETLAYHRSTGLIDTNVSAMEILGNPAPSKYRATRAQRSGELTRLLVVSNHIPAEVEQAIAALKDRVEVRILGGETDKGGVSTEIGPSDILWADGVVTIGKTVQYALVGDTPVYCYDHFGGPGWLTEENFAPARHANFSGRGFDEKAAGVIARELVEGFPRASIEGAALSARYADVFLLNSRLAALLETVTLVRRSELDTRDILAHLHEQELRRIFINVTASLEVSLIQVRQALLDAEGRAAHSSSRLEEVARSRSYRVSQQASSLLRQLRSGVSGAFGAWRDRGRRAERVN